MISLIACGSFASRQEHRAVTPPFHSEIRSREDNLTKALALLLLCSAASAHAGQDTSGYSVEARFPIRGTMTWDYITVDAFAHRLYVAHGTQVEVLNSDTGASIGVVSGTPGVHGIALAQSLGRGFTSNGGDDSVTIFDLKTLQQVGRVKVGSRPDRIFYDERSRRVFTCNHGSGDVSVIDARSGSVIAVLPIGGGGEQNVPAPGNRIYLAVADTSEVIRFDPLTLRITARFALGKGKEPHGLAFDEAHHRLFVACRNKLIVVLGSADGHVITTLGIGDTVDMAAFDPKTQNIFASNGDGSMSAFHEVSADRYKDLGRVETGPGAKQMDFNAQTGKLFLPTGTILESGLGANGKPNRSVREGSFAVLEVGSASR